MSEIHLCPAMTHPGSMHVDPEPPSYCEEEVLGPETYCPKHEEIDN